MWCVSVKGVIKNAELNSDPSKAKRKRKRKKEKENENEPQMQMHAYESAHMLRTHRMSCNKNIK